MNKSARGVRGVLRQLLKGIFSCPFVSTSSITQHQSYLHKTKAARGQGSIGISPHLLHPRFLSCIPLTLQEQIATSLSLKLFSLKAARVGHDRRTSPLLKTFLPTFFPSTSSPLQQLLPLQPPCNKPSTGLPTTATIKVRLSHTPQLSSSIVYSCRASAHLAQCLAQYVELHPTTPPPS